MIYPKVKRGKVVYDGLITGTVVEGCLEDIGKEESFPFTIKTEIEGLPEKLLIIARSKNEKGIGALIRKGDRVIGQGKAYDNGFAVFRTLYNETIKSGMGKLKGKKAFVVIPAAEGAGACGPMIDMFRMSFDYLEMEFAGKVLAKAYERGEIGSEQEALGKAYHLGASL